MEIAGKTALVTGGTDGIGIEIARQLMARGASVIVCGRRQALLDAAVAEGMEAIAADLSSGEGVAALVAAVKGRPLLVFCASLMTNSSGNFSLTSTKRSMRSASSSDACTAPIITRCNLYCGKITPGVSLNTIWYLSPLAMPRMRWRVVWALGVVIASLRPTSAFINVDLPALGLPMMLTKPDL